MSLFLRATILPLFLFPVLGTGVSMFGEISWGRGKRFEGTQVRWLWFLPPQWDELSHLQSAVELSWSVGLFETGKTPDQVLEGMGRTARGRKGLPGCLVSRYSCLLPWPPSVLQFRAAVKPSGGEVWEASAVGGISSGRGSMIGSAGSWVGRETVVGQEAVTAKRRNRTGNKIVFSSLFRSLLFWKVDKSFGMLWSACGTRYLSLKGKSKTTGFKIQ